MRKSILCTALLAIAATAAMASVTFDPATGTGFAGKGDVQLTFGWNNAVLQKNADGVQFRTTRTSVLDRTWTCDRDAGPQLLNLERTRTITIVRLLDSVGRLKAQITGFNLLGYAGDPNITTTVETTVNGQSSDTMLPFEQCPAGWTLTASNSALDPGVQVIQVQSTGPNPVVWTDIVQPAP